jgi:hypothetical protein
MVAYHLPVDERRSVTVLGLPSRGAVQDEGNSAELRDDQRAAHQLDAVAILGVGDGVVATEAFETRETRLVGPLAHAAQEGLEGQIDPLGDVLQNLGMHLFERWAGEFPHRQQALGLIPAHAAPFLFYCVLADCQRLVIDPAAFFRMALKTRCWPLVGQIRYL